MRYCVYSGISPNVPGLGLLPQENLVLDIVMEEIKPFVGAELTVDLLEFVKGWRNSYIKNAPPSSRATEKTLRSWGPT